MKTFDGFELNDWYSGGQQDIFVLSVFGTDSQGTFVDIGCKEPINHSNTALLEKYGWKGILIEPQKKIFSKLKNEYRKYTQNVITSGGGDGPSGNKIEEVEITTIDNRAFNLNELLNSRIPVNFEEETPSVNNNSTILMNPGVSAILTSTPDDPDVIKKSAYPAKTQMLPVGKFRVISKNCPNFGHDGQVPDPLDKGFYYAGRIVQMSAVPKETIQTIILYGVNNAPSLGFDAEKVKDDEVLAVNRDYMFLFDVENAHDGFCSTCD